MLNVKIRVTGYRHVENDRLRWQRLRGEVERRVTIV